MIGTKTLLSDQVFQLNTFLWALQELPESSQIQPVLRQAGYQLRYIEPRLIVPRTPVAIAALHKLNRSKDSSPCHPDLWLQHSEHPSELIVELKSQGFSPKSSNSRQALKLLLAAFDLSESLGEATQHGGHLIYATISDDTPNLEITLNDLASKLHDEGANAAPTSVIGFSEEVEGVAISSSSLNLPEPAANALTSPAVVLRKDDDNDLQPLYLIPWIPGIESSQNPQLQKAGYDELTSRVLTHVLSKIGEAQVPTTLKITGEEIMSLSTFKVFDRWRNDTRKQLARAVVKIINQALIPISDVVSRGDTQIVIELQDSETQEQTLRLIEQADHTSSTTNLKGAIEEQPTLFDMELTEEASGDGAIL